MFAYLVWNSNNIIGIAIKDNRVVAVVPKHKFLYANSYADYINEYKKNVLKASTTCSERQYRNTNGICSQCQQYQIQDPQDNRTCIQKKCGHIQRVTVDAVCINCSQNTIAHENGLTCVNTIDYVF